MITTPPEQIEAGLIMSLRRLDEQEAADMRDVLWTAMHAGLAFAAFVDEMPMGATLRRHDLKRLKAWADLENERRAG